MKKVLDILASPAQHWVGDGFRVSSVVTPDNELSPFLLLDYGKPTPFGPAEAPRGVGPHPHRGFETVTLVYQGGVAHRDSAGNGGLIGAGDVQWMTAASGVVHEEFHSPEFTKSGGTFEVAQIWVNLPRKDKMSKPAYQTLLASQIPVVPLAEGGGTVRLVGGDYGDVKGAARTHTPVVIWDLRLAAGKSTVLPIAEGFTAALFVRRGEIRIGAQSAGERQLVTLDRKGEGIALEAASDAEVIVLAGKPIDEPVVQYGPFVMNSEGEIRQAILDYNAGRMGAL